MTRSTRSATRRQVLRTVATLAAGAPAARKRPFQLGYASPCTPPPVSMKARPDHT
jgi:hypothetical protein